MRHERELLETRDWRRLCSAALLETDTSRTGPLIDDAERAIVRRARQLFGSPGENLIEEHALDSALFALHALKGCLAARVKSARAA
ncbi:MAG: hypothetical protein JO356_16655 [Acidobacteria bacterium]|nr:hypothetical protein [Acidobacteriota bacterium]